MDEDERTTLYLDVKIGDISYTVFMSGYDGEEVSEILSAIIEQ